MISPVSFNGVALNDGFFKSDLLDVFSSDKDLTLNDMLGDGQAWGSSKIAERKLVLNIVAGAHDLRKLMQLNQMVRGNQLKPLVIDADIGLLTGQAEVTSFAWSDDSPLIISAQLTMPDPYWYAQTAKSVQLGATYSTGVVFGAGQGVVFGPGQGVVFGVATGGAATITNEGNADAYPVIHVVGTCSGISVTNLTTGETVAVNAALSDDDTLVIDCRPATCGVYLNGVANIGLKSSPGWVRCVPGNNQLVFSRNSLQNKKHCTVELNERWI